MRNALYLKRNVIVVQTLVVLLSFIMGGCDAGFKVEVELDAINHLADVLAQWPTQWESSLNSTISDLEKAGTNLANKVAADVRLVLEESRMMATESIFCSVDFVGVRAEERTKEIRNKYWPKYPLPEYSPVVCGTQPELYIEYGTKWATYSGYNFQNYSKTYAANIENKNGEIILGNLPLIIKNDYEITVDLQSVNLRSLNLDSKQSPRLSLQWEGGESEILILIPGVIPEPPQAREYLKVGEFLKAGEWLVNANKTMFAAMQGDGNFVIYRGPGPGQDFGAVWDSKTDGLDMPCFAIMQRDGNFVIYRGYDPAHNYGAVWSTNTALGVGDYFAIMQNDGNFVIYRGTGPTDIRGVVWHTGTNIYK